MSDVLYHRQGRVVTITLNRPEKLNALSETVRQEFSRSLTEFIADDQARVAIIAGAGRAFCAGGDVSPKQSNLPAHLQAQPGGRPDVIQDWSAIRSGLDEWMRIWDAPKPVIAAVHGFCIGVGTYIPMFCDLTFVAEDARIGFPSMPLGAGVGAPLWSWLVGPKVAKAFSFRPGLHMSGVEAVNVGWANAAFPADRLHAEVAVIAEEIGRVPLEMLKVQKMAVNRVWDSQGFRASVAAGAEWDAVAHQVHELQTVRDWIGELGVAGAARRYAQEGL